MNSRYRILLMASLIVFGAEATAAEPASYVITEEVEWKATPRPIELPAPEADLPLNPIQVVKPPTRYAQSATIAADPAPAQPSSIVPAPAPAAITPPAPLVLQAPAASSPPPAPTILNLDPQATTPSRVWASAEYLNWWATGNHTPSLVSTAPTGVVGTLDNSQARSLFGPQQSGTNSFDGFRTELGLWLDPCATCGIEVGFFGFGSNSQNLAASSNGSPGLFRPFIDAQTGAPNAELMGYQYPNGAGGFEPIVSGAISVRNSTSFYGGDANFRERLCGDCCSRLDLIVGYLYMRLDDETTIAESLLTTDPLERLDPINTRFLVLDQFKTVNVFNGAQIGLGYEHDWGRWFGYVQGTVALGDTYQQTRISGTTQIVTSTGASATYPGGVLALASNSGTHDNNSFSVLPVVEADIGYQVTSYLRIFAGYNFMYWTNVVRSGNQIDPVVNPTLLPNNGPVVGPNRPIYPHNQSDFLAQGYNVGFEVRW